MANESQAWWEGLIGRRASASDLAGLQHPFVIYPPPPPFDAKIINHRYVVKLICTRSNKRPPRHRLSFFSSRLTGGDDSPPSSLARIFLSGGILPELCRRRRRRARGVSVFLRFALAVPASTWRKISTAVFSLFNQSFGRRAIVCTNERTEISMDLLHCVGNGRFYVKCLAILAITIPFFFPQNYSKDRFITRIMNPAL